MHPATYSDIFFAPFSSFSASFQLLFNFFSAPFLLLIFGFSYSSLAVLLKNVLFLSFFDNYFLFFLFISKNTSLFAYRKTINYY